MGLHKKRKRSSVTSNASFTSKSSRTNVSIITNRSMKRKKPKNKRKFNILWLEVEAFKPWIVLNRSDPHKAFCKICKMSMVARFNVLVNHGKSINHNKLSRNEKPPEDDKFLIPCRMDSEHYKKVAHAELAIVGACVKSNVAFHNIPSLVKAIKSINDPGTYRDVHISRTKARHLAVNVIGQQWKRILCDKLKNCKFAICVDESTDVSKEKLLAINVRFLNDDTQKVECKLWGMEPVFESDKQASAGAARLFQCIMNSFHKAEIPIDNIVACCFDGCQTMIGKKSGLKPRLEEAIPNIVCVQCPAHSTHLCAQHALDELPKVVVPLCTDITALLKSSNKLHNFGLHQIDEVPPHKILKLSDTRWLSLEQSTARILEQWPALLKFCKSIEETEPAAKTIVEAMEKHDTKMYFLLVQHILREINKLNKFFQTEGVIIHVLQNELEKRYRNIVSCILQRKYVISTPAQVINIFNEKQYLNYVDFNVGEELREILLRHGNMCEQFCKNAFNFVLSISIQMQERFRNFRNPIFQTAACLNPESTMSIKYRQANKFIFPELIKCFKKLSHGIETELRQQWDNLIELNVPKELQSSSQVTEFWIYVKSHDQKEIPRYSTLGNFALNVLLTPHANADTERTFSAQNNAKTKHRNKMAIPTLQGCLQAREYVRSSSEQNFTPTSAMITVAAEGQYYKYK